MHKSLSVKGRIPFRCLCGQHIYSESFNTTQATELAQAPINFHHLQWKAGKCIGNIEGVIGFLHEALTRNSKSHIGLHCIYSCVIVILQTLCSKKETTADGLCSIRGRLGRCTLMSFWKPEWSGEAPQSYVIMTHIPTFSYLICIR